LQGKKSLDWKQQFQIQNFFNPKKVENYQARIILLIECIVYWTLSSVLGQIFFEFGITGLEGRGIAPARSNKFPRQ
jgi:hypothetical protein